MKGYTRKPAFRSSGLKDISVRCPLYTTKIEFSRNIQERLRK